MRFETYRPALLPGVVRFWNRAFQGKRNFWAVDERTFRRRVTGRRGPGEAFDPRGFIVATERGEVAGMIHVVLREEALVRRDDPGWPGGPQGLVAFLWVDPARRRRGLGDALWHRGLERLRRARQVVLDGRCTAPFYGNSEAPSTPLWGTPEGPAVDWDDSGTKKFLARKGFAPRFRALQMAAALEGGSSDFAAARRAARRAGAELVERSRVLPILGRPVGERREAPAGADFDCVEAVRRGRTAGLLVFYPMRELGPGRFAIYEAAVAEAFRGKALGRHLLGGALAWMRARGGRSCEVLAVPELSPAAARVYAREGFETVAKWAIY